MCSTPQKQPAATVAFCAPSGTVMEAAIGPDENRREKNEVINRTRTEVTRMALGVGMVNSFVGCLLCGEGRSQKVVYVDFNGI